MFLEVSGQKLIKLHNNKRQQQEFFKFNTMNINLKRAGNFPKHTETTYLISMRMCLCVCVCVSVTTKDAAAITTTTTTKSDALINIILTHYRAIRARFFCSLQIGRSRELEALTQLEIPCSKRGWQGVG